jgi:hypothetical protein
MHIEEFVLELEKIDKNKISDEIFWWVKENILSYIDTMRTSYSLDFLADEQLMPETAKLEHLCYQLDPTDIDLDTMNTDSQADSIEEALKNPELIEETAKQESINEFMDSIRNIMTDNSEKREEIFSALSYFYDVVGFYDKKPIVKNLKGYVAIDYLAFENIRVPVTKTPMTPVYNEEGEVIDYKRDESKTEIVAEKPPAFSIDFSIDFWEDKGEQSLF